MGSKLTRMTNSAHTKITYWESHAKLTHHELQMKLMAVLYLRLAM